MPNLIKAKIDLAKIHGAKVLKKDNRIFIELTDAKLFEGKNGALYLDLAQFETEEDQYGNHWRISQDLPQPIRDAGTVDRGPIVGNGKNKTYGAANKPARSSATGSAGAKPTNSPAGPADNVDEDVPFACEKGI